MSPLIRCCIFLFLLSFCTVLGQDTEAPPYLWQINGEEEKQIQQSPPPLEPQEETEPYIPEMEREPSTLFFPIEEEPEEEIIEPEIIEEEVKPEEEIVEPETPKVIDEKEEPPKPALIRQFIREPTKSEKMLSIIREAQGKPKEPEVPEVEIFTEELPEEAVVKEEPPKPILINFTNVNAVELIRFISRISNKNFIFNEDELQFNMSIVSEEPTSIDNVMTALLQELRIHGMTLIENGNSMIIHANPDVKGVARVSINKIPDEVPREVELITQVFRLNTLDPEKAQEIIKSLLSADAIVESSKDTRHVIVTDLANNIEQIAVLLKSLDAPQNGLTIGQYAVKNTTIDTLLEITQQIMEPIAQDQHYVLVPHTVINSIFIVSSPFLVERTIAVLKHLDQLQGTTRTFDPEELRYRAPEKIRKGRWELDPEGNWIFRREKLPDEVVPEEPPKGRWVLDEDGNWYFLPEDAEKPLRDRVRPAPPEKVPDGRWQLSREGDWIYQLAPGAAISPERLVRKPKISPDLPVGHIERTRFYLHKLKYRNGGEIVDALQKIGDSLVQTGTYNEDLVGTINSIQWIESPNMLVFTGTNDSIAKVKELIEEIDTPLRQVFIEMLILETTVDDSLTYGVDWITRSGGANTSTAQGFLSDASTLPTAMDTTGIGTITGIVKTPDANTLARTAGLNLGIIGQIITHNGTQFSSIGALVNAIHDNTRANIIMNPKLLVEDNSEAEIFVGVNTPFQTDSISNEEGSIITTNFEFKDVGTRLKVKPLLSSDDIVTLEIEQEISSVASVPEGAAGGGGGGNQQQQTSPGPTTRKSTTTTKVHVPNKHFLIISGMIQNETTRTRSQIPCLGGIPFIGSLFSDKDNIIQKRNIMIFIRPQIIDTVEEIQNLTKRQQDIYKVTQRSKNNWKYEVEEGLDFLNLRNADCENVCE